jgi:hypothetical protein
MKSLNDLSNLERGKLLAELFPEEIHNILKAVGETCEELEANTAAYRAQWKDPLLNFDFWMHLSKNSYFIITRYKHPKQMNIRVIIEQLFFGHNALFTINCVLKYAEKGVENSKLKQAIELLFGQ